MKDLSSKVRNGYVSPSVFHLFIVSFLQKILQVTKKRNKFASSNY